MGAGKTTFIHALCEVKGVKDVVGSPTFSIINEYYCPSGKIFHIDLYRLKDEEEAIRAGVEDCLYSDHICFVEWPEKAPDLFPNDTVHVFIEVADSETRHLTIQDKQLFLTPGLNATIKQWLRRTLQLQQFCSAELLEAQVSDTTEAEKNSQSW